MSVQEISKKSLCRSKNLIEPFVNEFYWDQCETVLSLEVLTRKIKAKEVKVQRT